MVYLMKQKVLNKFPGNFNIPLFRAYPHDNIIALANTSDYFGY